MSSRSLVSRLLRPRLRGANARLAPAALSTRARLLATLSNIPIFRALTDHDPSTLAVIHSASARSFTYGNLVADVLRAKEDFEQKAAAKSNGQLAGERVAFLAENSYDYVGTVTYFPLLWV